MFYIIRFFGLRVNYHGSVFPPYFQQVNLLGSAIVSSSILLRIACYYVNDFLNIVPLGERYFGSF